MEITNQEILTPTLSFSRRGGSEFARPLVMGIVNITPDSFYEQGRSPSTEDAVETARRFVQEGADLIDIGGQSTRPGSEPVGTQEELLRVRPVIEALAREIPIPISIDTDKAAVAAAALAAGARILNDVSALRGDPEMAEIASQFEAVILMHRGGESPKNMQKDPQYKDVVAEVSEFLRERMDYFRKAGGQAGRVFIDPGIGFGKNLEHNLALLKHLKELGQIAPVALGASRKSFLAAISKDEGPSDRLAGSLAVACWAALSGVKILRVHDVKATRKALETWSAVGGAR